MKICIDPGHGGRSPGAKGSYSFEKDINLKISLKLKDALEKAGIETVLTRKDDSYVGLKQRCDIANFYGCDYFLSIHCNGFRDRNVSGTEVFYYRASSEGKAFAKAVHDSAMCCMKGKNRGVKPGDYYVLRKTVMIAVLLEVGFITNIDEEKILNSAVRQAELAGTIAASIAGHEA